MRNKLISILSIILVIALFTGCAAKTNPTSTPPESSAGSSVEISSEEPPVPEWDKVVRVGALKGATGIGMVQLITQSEAGTTKNMYSLTLESAPDLLGGMLLKGDVDIAALPVNLASVLYNKSGKELTFLGVNTLGVTYLLTNGTEITSLEDLRGQEIYLIGQGTTPEYTLRYLLKQAGIDPDTDVTLVFEAEGPTLLAKIAVGEVPIAVLPEPFVSTAVSKNPDVKVALDLTKEWETATGGKVLTTGGVVVRNQFLEEHPEAVADFMEEYAASIVATSEQIDETILQSLHRGLFVSDEVARLAIPRCNIVFLTGAEMQTAVTEYLTILAEYNPQAVGGTLPDEAFFYQPVA